MNLRDHRREGYITSSEQIISEAVTGQFYFSGFLPKKCSVSFSALTNSLFISNMHASTKNPNSSA
jgi:hypothetical protein